jgi:hypothetical protein
MQQTGFNRLHSRVAHSCWLRTRNAAPGRERSGRNGERGGAQNWKGEFTPTSSLGRCGFQAAGQIP